MIYVGSVSQMLEVEGLRYELEGEADQFGGLRRHNRREEARRKGLCGSCC